MRKNNRSVEDNDIYSNYHSEIENKGTIILSNYLTTNSKPRLKYYGHYVGDLVVGDFDEMCCYRYVWQIDNICKNREIEVVSVKSIHEII